MWLVLLWLATTSVVVSLAKAPPVEANDLYNLNNNNDNNRQEAATCGYESCPTTDPNKINVHIIAHTHDDVGWLKTVDQYYYGTNKRNSDAGVQFILDSIVPQLMMDKDKRFIYVEMSFFSKWWNEQDAQMRSIVRRLVNEGRLEFINGGWCMNDEATVNYHSTIEQMTLGLKFLNETFGACGRPKVGWQIDPFGHTNEQASLFAQFGFDGMYFTRISYEDKRDRESNKSLDLIWHGDRALPGQSGSIFTNIFRDGYDSPNGFCFDALCKDDMIVDNKQSYEYNLEDKGQYMIEFMRKYAKVKLTNQLLIPFGGDFQYTAAGQNFKSIDKLLRYIRSNAPDLNVFYSTPSCYQYSLHKELNSDTRTEAYNLPEKFDDFIPYDSSPSIWWSGYFTSRPSVKLIERETADLLQVARLISLASLLRYPKDTNWVPEISSHSARCLGSLWEVLGDLQHHDAVTGTEKQHVANDYVRRASDASTLCAKFLGDIRRARFNDLMRKSAKYDQLRELASSNRRQFKQLSDPVYLEETMFCPLLNISQCDALESEVSAQKYTLLGGTVNHVKPNHRMGAKLPVELETKGVLLTAYNPLARPINQVDIRLPCNGRCELDRVQVIHVATNESMKLVRLSVLAGITSLPFRESRTTNEILFYANVPALGSTSFVISDTNPDDIVDEEIHPQDSIVITDETPSLPNKPTTEIKARRLTKRHDVIEAKTTKRYEYFEMSADGIPTSEKQKRDLSQVAADRVIVKFDMNAGQIVGLRRASDGSALNITQKFGSYYPSNFGEPSGAYVFRVNSTTPDLMEKPQSFKMLKRQNGALIEIHQKWSDWIWQTVRVDAKKNYIEFDYLVGPVPVSGEAHAPAGREVITRYITNMANEGVFFTDSNGRQLLPRHRLRRPEAEQLGGSFFPVVSTMLLRNNSPHRSNKSAEAVAVLVDRAQAATSLNEGNLEFLIHRRLLKDDHFGVDEALNEPGEDRRGLVTRGRHRLYLKFQDLKPTVGNADDSSRATAKKANQKPVMVKLTKTPRSNVTFAERQANKVVAVDKRSADTYLVHDQLLTDLKIESIKYALKPILTFDRLRVTASEFIEMLASDGATIKTDFTLLNTSLPSNVHLLTLQPWTRRPNELLIRLESLENPLTLHPNPDAEVYSNLVSSYTRVSTQQQQEDLEFVCKQRTEIDVEYLIKKIRIYSLEEMTLGANGRLSESRRIDWTNEPNSDDHCETQAGDSKATIVKLGPRQIRTFLASFKYI